MDAPISFNNNPFYIQYCQLRKEGVSGLPAIMDFVHSISKETTDSGKINEYFISFLKSCLSKKEDYSCFIDRLKECLPQHTRCHHIFTDNDYSYICKDCSFGDSSCMCSECFDIKCHDGHDFQRHMSSGGCCDCGDPESWKRECWCKKHRNSVQIKNPDLLIDRNNRQDITDVMDACALLILCCMNSEVQNPFPFKIKPIVRFVVSFFEVSQSTARVVSRSFRKSYSLDQIQDEMNFWSLHPAFQTDDLSYVSLLMQSLTINPYSKETIPLLLCLLFDSEYKEAFIPVYLKELPRVFKMTCSEITTIINRLITTPESSTNQPDESVLRFVSNGIGIDMNDSQESNNEDDNGVVVMSEEEIQQLNQFIEDNADFDDVPHDEMFIDIIPTSEESDSEDISSEESDSEDISSEESDSEDISSEESDLEDTSPSNEYDRGYIQSFNKGYAECPRLIYEDFICSLHCQLFHNASTVHLRSDYPSFIKSFLKEMNDIMKTIKHLYPHDFFTSGSSVPLLQLLFCAFTTFDTIIEENCDPAYALFEETVTNGIHSIKCIPEFVEFLSLLQV